MTWRSVAYLAVALAGLLGAHLPAGAQAADPAAASGARVTRAELEGMLARATETAQGASSAPVREQARTEAALIRARLESGDLRAGDRVLLAVENQPLLTDTFTVSAARTVELPGLGEVDLSGVLRSELAPHLAAHVARVTTAPLLEAQVLIALDIRGSVARPGRYGVPAETPVADVLGVAGGATSVEAQGRTRIRRGGDVIWEGLALRSAELMGLTLDQLSLGSGDRIEVDGGSEGVGGLLRTGVLTVGAVASFFAILAQSGLF